VAGHLRHRRRPWLSGDARTVAGPPQPHPRLQSDEHGYDHEFDLAENHDDVFSKVRRSDILLHHPYHSFNRTVQRFLDEAANDPDVLAIKAAIYRTATDSQVIQSLIDAADNGKQVAVMVELKARFDEQNNLEWVHRLEEHGIHVAYGTIGLKTHTKTALVVRQEDESVQLYSHVASGNYHSGTAKSYVDLGLLTADRDIGQDLVKVVNSFTGPSLDDQFRKLLIAPVTMRESFTQCIRREAALERNGDGGRIVAKVNGLEDPEIVKELYATSQAGVGIASSCVTSAVSVPVSRGSARTSASIASSDGSSNTPGSFTSRTERGQRTRRQTTKQSLAAIPNTNSDRPTG
jgi:polyphosphate kinase